MKRISHYSLCKAKAAATLTPRCGSNARQYASKVIVIQTCFFWLCFDFVAGVISMQFLKALFWRESSWQITTTARLTIVPMAVRRTPTALPIITHSPRVLAYPYVSSFYTDIFYTISQSFIQFCRQHQYYLFHRPFECSMTTKLWAPKIIRSCDNPPQQRGLN